MTGSEHEHGHRARAVAAGHASHRRRMMPRFARWPRSLTSRWARNSSSLWLRSWSLRRWMFDFVRSRLALRLFLGSAACFVFATLAALGLWWRLSSGPIELNLATPWLKAAIEDNFGGKHTVVVGGTQLERDERGRTSLRLRDIVVRDPDGTVVASAPKAEVGLSGRSLLMGRLRAPLDRSHPVDIRWRRQTADSHGCTNDSAPCLNGADLNCRAANSYASRIRKSCRHIGQDRCRG